MSESKDKLFIAARSILQDIVITAEECDCKGLRNKAFELKDVLRAIEKED